MRRDREDGVAIVSQHTGQLPPVRVYASIHPLNRAMEWACKKDKRGWLHDDVCPTVTANEYRSVGNVIYELYETE